jgi:hypothetical protein
MEAARWCWGCHRRSHLQDDDRLVERRVAPLAVAAALRHRRALRLAVYQPRAIGVLVHHGILEAPALVLVARELDLGFGRIVVSENRHRICW